jgi:hypothetical protein
MVVARSKTTPQKPRKGATGRSDRSERRRPGSGGGSAEGASTIIADSLFTLRLQELPGIEVRSRMGEKNVILSGGVDYRQMYNDLRAAFIRATKLLTGETTAYDPVSYGYTVARGLGMITQAFKNNIVPEGMSLAIKEGDRNQFKYVIYTYTDFPEFYCPFQIKPVVEYLAKTDHLLLDLFLDVIAFFYRSCGISTWFDSPYGYADYRAEELIDRETWDEYYGEDSDASTELENARYEHFIDTYFDYHGGQARFVQSYLQGSFKKPDYLAAQVDKVRPGKLKEFMTRALELAAEPYTVHTFLDNDISENEPGECVAFDRQVAIIWDWLDPIAELEDEGLEIEAQNGMVIPPVVKVYVSGETKELDLSKDAIDKKALWPTRLGELQAFYQGKIVIPINKAAGKQKDIWI